MLKFCAVRRASTWRTAELQLGGIDVAHSHVTLINLKRASESIEARG